MTGRPNKRETKHPTPTRKRLRLFLLGTAALAIALYAATPFLVARLTPHFAGRLGLKTLELTVGHLGLRGVTIDDLVAATDTFVIRGENARLAYSWSGLRKRRIDRLDFAALEISLSSGPPPDQPHESPTDGQLIPALPFSRLSAERLVLKMPDTGFVGVGRAELGDAGLSLSMDGIEPELASRFSVTASLARDGLFDARFGERGDGAAEFLSMRGALTGDTVGIESRVNLSGYPLQLASEFAGLPQGTGSVTSEIQTRLPWPLPANVSWQDVVATVPAFAIDWVSAKNDFELSAISGSAKIDRGDVTTSLSGALRYRKSKREITVRAPANYELGYRHDTLTGAAGLGVRITGSRTDAAATLRSFTMSPAPDIGFAIDADIDGKIDFLQATGRLQGTLEGEALSIEADLKLAGQPQGRSRVDSITEGTGAVAGRLQTRLPWPLPDTFSWQDLEATVPSFSIDWQSAKNVLELNAITGSAELDKGNIGVSLAGALRYRKDGRDITARLPNDYQLDFEQKTLTGAAGLRVRMKEAKTDTTATLRSFALTVAPTIKLVMDADVDGRIGTVRGAGRLKGRATLDDARKPIATGRLDFAGALHTPDDRRDGRLDTTFRLAGDALSVNGTLASGVLEKVPFSLSHDLASGGGKLDATSTIDIREPLAAALRPGWDEDYDLDAGRVDVALNLRWLTPERIAAAVVLTLADVSAHYREYRATGITGRLNLRADDSLNKADWLLEPTLLDIERVDVGTPLDDIRLGLAWSGDRVDVTKGRGAVLGGIATATPFAFDIPTGSAAFELALTGIDLATALALEGDDIDGTGTLDGTLPVTITNNQARVEGGVMAARSPGGVIRLTPTLAGAAGQSDLTFALAALQDFSYTVLNANIDYGQNGDLVLAVHLEGRNPTVEKGRPIHYNLNITENVPVLLESLRLKDAVTEGIEKKVKK